MATDLWGAETQAELQRQLRARQQVMVNRGAAGLPNTAGYRPPIYDVKFGTSVAAPEMQIPVNSASPAAGSAAPSPAASAAVEPPPAATAAERARQAAATATERAKQTAQAAKHGAANLWEGTKNLARTGAKLGGAYLVGNALLSDDLYGGNPERIARGEMQPTSTLGGVGLPLGRGAGYVSEASRAASERTPDYLADVRNESNPFTIGAAAMRQFGTYGRNLTSELFNPSEARPSIRTPTVSTPAAAPTTATPSLRTNEMGPPAPSDADLWNRDLKDREAALAAIRTRSQVRPEFSAIGLDDADTARNLRQAEQMRANIANFPEQYTNAQGEVIRPRENAMRSMQEGAYNAGPEISEAQAKQNLAERLAKYEAASRSIQATRAMQAGVPVEAMEATGGNLRKAIAMSQAAAASNLARNARSVPGYGGRGGYGPQAAAAPAQPASPYTPEGVEFAKAMAGGNPVLGAEMIGAASRLPKEAQPRTGQEMAALMALFGQFGGMRPNLPGPAAQVPLADFAGVRKEPVKGVWPTVTSWTPWGHNKRYVAYNRAGQPFDTGVTARDDGFFMDPVVDPQLESLLDPRLRGR